MDIKTRLEKMIKNYIAIAEVSSRLEVMQELDADESEIVKCQEDLWRLQEKERVLCDKALIDQLTNINANPATANASIAAFGLAEASASDVVY